MPNQTHDRFWGDTENDAPSPSPLANTERSTATGSSSSSSSSSSTQHANNSTFPKALTTSDQVTILAYGALLSEESSRLTFPALQNFRYVQVRGLRRVFAHPHLFLVGQGLTEDPPINATSEESTTPTRQWASLSAEYHAESSIVVAAFDVTLNDDQRRAFLAREASYDIVLVPYYPLSVDEDKDKNKEDTKHQDGDGDNDQEAPRFTSISDSTELPPPPLGEGVICLASTDERQAAHLANLPPSLPVRSLWHWPRDSGLLPAAIYLRHCLLAVDNASTKEPRAKVSFWKDTYLADRTTTLAQYLTKDTTTYEQIINSRPPPELATRFGG
jgi:hypothetical protein